MQDYQEQYQAWLARLADDDPLKQELLAIQDDEAEKQDRFYQNLAFGTAGLRGKIGAGTNRMNVLTVAQATRGVGNFILKQGREACQAGVIIAHDPRHFSKEFSQLTAVILADLGIRVYTFPDLRPTPELAFMIRELHTASGINITASHNPKEYNGYKVYWSDGCQIGSEIAAAMMAEIQQVDLFAPLPEEAYEDLVRAGKITVLDERYDRKYLDKIESLKIHDGEELDRSIPLVYTPLNGAGSIPFRKMLEERGFTCWQVVPEQKDPDPDFTTVGYPNPEDPRAFRLSEELGRKTVAELLMATDPDSDRFAIELRNEDGEYVPLNGNQTGYLLVNYILEGRQSAGTLPAKGAMVKSIVTSTLSTIIAEHYHVRMFEALTGFKNICGRIPEIQQQGYTYLFGYEESVGYSACVDIRDKDGISAGMLVAEAAAYYRRQGRTLWQVLQEIYETYGWFAELEPNLVLEGLEGKQRIARMMQDLRQHPLTSAGGQPLARVVDYQNGYEDIPAADVLRYWLADGSWFAIRPSGTEPKIKFYFYGRGRNRQEAEDLAESLRQDVLARVESVQ